MSNPIDRLRRLADEYENKAAAIRVSLSLLEADAQASGAPAVPGKLRAGIAILAASKNGHGDGLSKQQAINAAAASLFADHDPITSSEIFDLLTRSGVVVSRSYMQKALGEFGARVVGRGKWSRGRATSTTTSRPTYTSKRAAQAQRSAALLQWFNGEARSLDDVRAAITTSDGGLDTKSLRGIGSLVRRGYLKRKRGGYVRTAKVFAAAEA